MIGDDRQHKIKHRRRAGLRLVSVSRMLGINRDLAMQRNRAIAIAAAHRQERVRALTIAAAMLLLPAALLLLLISP